MTILLNDNTEVLPDNVVTVSDLVKWKNIPAQGTAIAVNDKLIRQQQWDQVKLSDGEQITVISAAYGG